MSTAATTDPTGPGPRRVPPLGGFSAAVLGIELRRMLRNRRTVVLAVVLPSALCLSFGGAAGWNRPVGDGDVAAYVMVSMALYGAALTAASAGAGVAAERALGWTRQLRLTPLLAPAYVAMKAVVALALGALAVAAVNVTGILQGRAAMPIAVWLGCAALTVVCTLVFAALGVFVGYLVPGENAPFLGPLLALLAFLGDVFIPLDPGSVLYRVAEWTPMFGVAEISRAPLTGDLPLAAVLNASIWFAVFVAGAAWRMSKDTARA